MRIPLTIALLVSAPAWLAAQAPAPPYVKPEGLRQLSPHVHVIPDKDVPGVPNVGIIVGSAAVLVVDTGLGPPNGAKVLAEAQRLGGSRPLYLVTTHVHPEHDLGAQAFPAAAMLIRSIDQNSDIAEFGLRLAQVFASRSPIHAELLKGAEFRNADITFEHDYELDLGDVRAHIVAMGANHTRGDTVVWIEADRVLFAGDIAMAAQPAFASPYSNLGHWLDSLDRLEELNPIVIVPSHGPIGGGTVFISGYRSYLTEVRDRTAAEKRAGKTVEQITETVTAAMADRYPNRARLAGAIKAAFAEAR
jgi:glyoxylase-like metal-dependent hydrolase (beta-lactamase superfamily II)